MATDWGDPPAELAGLDARLTHLEFAPRASLAPAGLGGHAGATVGAVTPGRWRLVSRIAAATAAAASVALAIAAGVATSGRSTVVDRCCADLDGGGLPDDGVLLLALPPDRVLMAVVYEQTKAPATDTAR